MYVKVDNETAQTHKLYGLGGWAAVLILYLLLNLFGAGMRSIGSGILAVNEWNFERATQLVSEGITFLLLLMTVIFFYRRSRWFVYLLVLMGGLSIFSTLINLLDVFYLSDVPPEAYIKQFNDEHFTTYWKSNVYAVLGPMIYLSYVLRSERINVTFLGRTPQPVPNSLQP